MNCSTPYDGFLNIINSMYRRVRKTMLDNLALFLGYAFISVGGIVVLFAALAFFVEIIYKIQIHFEKFLKWLEKERRK